MLAAHCGLKAEPQILDTASISEIKRFMKGYFPCQPDAQHQSSNQLYSDTQHQSYNQLYSASSILILQKYQWMLQCHLTSVYVGDGFYVMN
jgi:hypothetical protein